VQYRQKERVQPTETIHCDVALIGAGIMSATLGVLLRELDPSLTIHVFERLDHAAAESSDAWNNAGTGHSAFCEMNYTPEREDGSIDISKAVKVAESFEVSKQWWASLIESGKLCCPEEWIRPIPHEAFVWGAEDVAYLRKRYEAMIQSPLFKGMQHTENRNEIATWMPVVMEGRDETTPIAATRMDLGTDVNFGALTRALFACLQQTGNAATHYNQEVRDLEQLPDKTWAIRIKDHDGEGKRRTVVARFVFIGAGGGALPLLLKSDIPEGHHYGGFPVSGQWLICKNEDVIKRHYAKVYGKAGVGAPPMSVPHLDTRFIDGRRALMFGPYAGFSTKFLKHGSLMDLPKSITLKNLAPMVMAGLHNFPLTRYLIEQVTQSDEARLKALQDFMPTAKEEDWELALAGQRVQVIKKDEEEGGILEFGTEVVAAADGSLAALLGASPGASTAVSIMLSLLEKCFPERLATVEWRDKLKEMIPSYGRALHEDEELLNKMREWTSKVLLGA
jgi:malate dehydrogenase (quinone)